ncbi:MAG TPA: hypothetical protein VMM77_06915 [Gemmatimonadaceae bacterium]|nr:hypothetical protein [Gemmatimonadaceae bacterium]
MSSFRFSSALLLLALAVQGCAQQRRAESASTTAPVGRPLAAMSEQPLILLPARHLRAGDSLGWASRISNEGDWLANVDSEIAFALSERGAGRRWTLPEELARSARRNAAFAPDPSTIAVQAIRPSGRALPPRVPEPLISQLRSLIALRDGVRYALLPVEVRFEPVSGMDGGRAVLNLVLVDVRASEIVWALDVESEPAANLSPALAASLASRLADLVAAP